MRGCDRRIRGVHAVSRDGESFIRTGVESEYSRCNVERNELGPRTRPVFGCRESGIPPSSGHSLSELSFTGSDITGRSAVRKPYAGPRPVLPLMKRMRVRIELSNRQQLLGISEFLRHLQYSFKPCQASKVMSERHRQHTRNQYFRTIQSVLYSFWR